MRILVSRLGAFGDCLIVTPLVRYLAERGDEVYLLTSDQGLEIFANNPHVAKIIHHVRDSIPSDKLQEYFDATMQGYECQKHIGLSESIEVNLALHPNSPRYKYTKAEKMQICNRNYYEETFKFAGMNALEVFHATEVPKIDQTPLTTEAVYRRWNEFLRPELFYTPQEITAMEYELLPFHGKRILIWGLSGSARNKVYPHWAKVIMHVLEHHEDVVVLTVGDELCRMLEFPLEHARIYKRAGKWTMRQSALACKYAALVVSPDTGLLHASGCFETPKIGLLNHTTRENITKHFLYDHSIEAEGVGCAPCFQIHYVAKRTCNLDLEDGRAALCMSEGILPERVIDRIKEVLG